VRSRYSTLMLDKIPFEAFMMKLFWGEKVSILGSWNYRSPATFGNFLSDLQFFNLGLWYVKWDLYGHEWGLSNHLTPSNP
jgi:hypothetical protein